MRRVALLAGVVLALAGCSQDTTTPAADPAPAETSSVAPPPAPTRAVPSNVQELADRVGCELEGTGDGTDYHCGQLLITDWRGLGYTEFEVMDQLEANRKDGLTEAYLYMNPYMSLQGSQRAVSEAARHLG